MTERPDINNDDIAEIIERADTLQNKERDHNHQHISQNDLKDITRELDIDDRFVEEAIRQMNAERNPPPPEPAPEPEPKPSKPITLRLSLRELILGAVAFAAVCVAIALFFRSGSQPVNITNNNTQIVQAVDPKPAEKKIAKPVTVKPKPKPKPKKPVVIEPEPEPKPDPQPKPEPEQKTEPEPETKDRKEVEPEPEPKVEKKSDPEPPKVRSKDLRKVSKMLAGEWELVSYHLYKNGYFEVPVTKNKIELRESWKFRNGKFSHIMDRKLSFSGKYEIVGPVPLPDPPKILPKSISFTLHSTDIMASLGFQRKHNFHYGEITKNTLILYFMGFKLTGKQPTQGHEYRRVR